MPSPILDDRDFDDLVEEAKRRIAAKCPGWTDFNPSDPGMTLVELMAWMTETVLYRLNRVPDLNYSRYLELIGVRLQPARPARTWIFFEVQEAQDQIADAAAVTVPRGISVSTRPRGGRDPVAFVTCDDLHLTSCQIIKTCSRYGSPEQEEILNLHGANPWETDLFRLPTGDGRTVKTVEHNLYLGDSALRLFASQTKLTIRVNVDESKIGDPLFLEWQTWTGDSWQTVSSGSEMDKTLGFHKTGEIVFDELPLMKRCKPEQFKLTSTDQSEAFWLRARLMGSKVLELPSLLDIRRRISSKGCVALPDKAFVKVPPREIPDRSADKLPYLPIELPPHPLETSSDFSLLGTEVVKDSIFYLSSELFQPGGAAIEIEFRFRSPLNKENCEEFEIHWEYKPSGADWRTLGQSGLDGPLERKSGFDDTTNAFSQNGKVKFVCPDDITQIDIAGQPGWFVRARVAKARFRQGHKAEIRVSSILLGFEGKFDPWAHCFSENYSSIKEHSAGSRFAPFFIDVPQHPAFYICLNSRPSTNGGPYGIFLDVVRQDTEVAVAKAFWEYSSRGGDSLKWKAVRVVADTTEGFAQAGFLKFLAADDWNEVNQFGSPGFWLRVRWEADVLSAPIRLRRVLLNGVEVEQTLRTEQVIGSSDATPNQSFSLDFSILDYPQVFVRETDDKSVDGIKTLKLGKGYVPDQDEGWSQDENRFWIKQDKEGLSVMQDNGGWWVRWKEMQNFHGSKVRDPNHLIRHFTVDLETGTFTFGDGKYGSIPPGGRDNIKVEYRTTEGASGNVGSQAIVVLDKGLPSVKGVKNYHPAQGGADQEDVERAKQRGPSEIKHRDRAVTEGDFVELAQKASQLVGKASCFQERGLVHVVIIPNDRGVAPTPSPRLIEDVRAYLDGRKLINTRLVVEGPMYEELEVQIDVALTSLFTGGFGDIEIRIKEALNQFVHPLTGMDDGSGWPMGRALHESELYYLIESLPDIDYVGTLKIFKKSVTGKNQTETRLEMNQNSFPCFNQEMKIRRIFD